MKHEKKAGRPPIDAEPLIPFTFKFRRQQEAFIRQQENQSAWMRALVDREIAKAERKVKS